MEGQSKFPLAQFIEKIVRFAEAKVRAPVYGYKEPRDCDGASEANRNTRVVTVEWLFSVDDLTTAEGRDADPETYLGFAVSSEGSKNFAHEGDDASLLLNAQRRNGVATPPGPIVLLNTKATKTSNDSCMSYNALMSFVPSARNVSGYGKPSTIRIPIGRSDFPAALHDIDPQISDDAKTDRAVVESIIANDPMAVHLSPGILESFVVPYSGDGTDGQADPSYALPVVVFGAFVKALVGGCCTVKTIGSKPGPRIECYVLYKHDYDQFIRNAKQIVAAINKSTMEFSSSHTTAEARRKMLADIDPAWVALNYPKDFYTRLIATIPTGAQRTTDPESVGAFADAVRLHVAGVSSGRSDAVDAALKMKNHVELTFTVDYVCPVLLPASASAAVKTPQSPTQTISSNGSPNRVPRAVQN